MPPNFYHQVSFSRLFFFGATFFFGTTFFSARLFVFGTISFRHEKVVPEKTKSRARKKKVVPKKKFVPEKTDVVKKKHDDKN